MSPAEKKWKLCIAFAGYFTAASQLAFTEETTPQPKHIGLGYSGSPSNKWSSVYDFYPSGIPAESEGIKERQNSLAFQITDMQHLWVLDQTQNYEQKTFRIPWPLIDSCLTSSQNSLNETLMSCVMDQKDQEVWVEMLDTFSQDISNKNLAGYKKVLGMRYSWWNHEHFSPQTTQEYCNSKQINGENLNASDFTKCVYSLHEAAAYVVTRAYNGPDYIIPAQEDGLVANNDNPIVHSATGLAFDHSTDIRFAAVVYGITKAMHDLEKNEYKLGFSQGNNTGGYAFKSNQENYQRIINRRYLCFANDTGSTGSICGAGENQQNISGTVLNPENYMAMTVYVPQDQDTSLQRPTIKSGWDLFSSSAYLSGGSYGYTIRNGAPENNIPFDQDMNAIQDEILEVTCNVLFPINQKESQQSRSNFVKYALTEFGHPGNERSFSSDPEERKRADLQQTAVADWFLNNPVEKIADQSPLDKIDCTSYGKEGLEISTADAVHYAFEFINMQSAHNYNGDLGDAVIYADIFPLQSPIFNLRPRLLMRYMDSVRDGNTYPPESNHPNCPEGTCTPRTNDIDGDGVDSFIRANESHTGIPYRNHNGVISYYSFPGQSQLWIDPQSDNCMFHPNASQADGDNDGIGDACDNCELIWNPNQEDSNINGVGDACDQNLAGTDTDGDGLLDADEIATLGTNVFSVDTDHDGLKDGDEVNILGTSPAARDTDKDGVEDGDEDTDQDGLKDGYELNALRSSPLLADSDEDGIDDGNDNCATAVNTNQTDTDNDGIGDICDPRQTVRDDYLDIHTFGTTNTAPKYRSGFNKTAISQNTDSGRALAQQNDGKLIVAGSAHGGVNQDFVLVRYNADGSIDSSFGNSGIAILNINGNDNAYSVVIQTDGKIVVAGNSKKGSNNFQTTLARFNSDGTIDNGFGTNGIVTVNTMTNNGAYSVIQDHDGRLVTGGFAYDGTKYYAEVIRFTANGSLDTSFDADGKATYSWGTSNNTGAYSIIELKNGAPAGNLVIAGWRGSNTMVMRIAENGEKLAQNNFTLSGNNKAFAVREVQTDINNPNSWAVATAGVVTSGSGNNNPLLVRFNIDNLSTDTSFGNNGYTVTNISNGNDEARDIAQREDGALMITGVTATTSNGNDVLMALYYTDGTFYGSLATSVSDGTGNDTGMAMLQQPDKKWVIAGEAIGADGTPDFAILRYVIPE